MKAKKEYRLNETGFDDEKMKTLILNGSPRISGDTVSLINLLTSDIEGEIKTVNAYRCDISACMDCRYCWNNEGCAINDEMQDVYKFIEECDNIVIPASFF